MSAVLDSTESRVPFNILRFNYRNCKCNLQNRERENICTNAVVILTLLIVLARSWALSRTPPSRRAKWCAESKETVCVESVGLDTAYTCEYENQIGLNDEQN